MNLLPKTREEFSQKDYWDSFFKKRGNKAFEWYGEYPELCGHLHKYVKTKDNILIVGCGNSTLGNDLYDIGYKTITNIDISQVAIRQMKSLNATKRPDLNFIQMDALNMSFPPDSFSSIIDKGTLDALMPNDSPETLTQINKYFSEILRVLKTGGRYICISLLQEHILNFVVEYFPKENCMFRIVRCYEAEKSAAEAGESSMPVFIIVCTKFTNLPVKILELNLSSGGSMQRYEKEEDLVKQVKAVQHAAFICSGLKRTTIDEGNDISFNMFRQNEEIPRYTIYVVDIPPARKNMQYAAFIVPQGRETDWLFSTKEGRKQLTEMSSCNRLSVVTMHRGQVYENLDAVKAEVEDSIRNLAPATIGNDKILFLSLGTGIGTRKVCHEGESKFSGKYIVEDASMDEKKYRRLYYLNSQQVIQSEAKFKSVKSRKGKFKEVIDVTCLTCDHHVYMSIGSFMATAKKENPSVALIGLGGGGLCSFLRKFLPKVSVTAVDIDPDMLKVATEWFGLVLDNKTKVEIEDGLEYLKNCNKNNVKFDAILFDVDSKDQSIGMSCPPKAFLTQETLQNVIKVLNPQGLFILNVVLRDSNLRPGVLSELSRKFLTICSYKLERDLNEVFICSAEKLTKHSVKTSFDQATCQINSFFHENDNNDLIEEVQGKDLMFHDVRNKK